MRLACADYGGTGAPVVLLYGLCGHAGEWAETASGLSTSRRVVIPEQRGHGRSDRQPADMSRAAFVEDVAMWVQELGLAPAVFVGHSLGGHTALLLAARHPNLVRGLVVAEATPQANPDAPRRVRAWLEEWPKPFQSREQAVAFFGGDTPRARAWGSGLEQRDDGLWPWFEIPVVLNALNEIACCSYWGEWANIRCPVLVVCAQVGAPNTEIQRMLELVPRSRLVEIANAGHDIHLDQPERWRQALETFISVEFCQ